MLWPGSSLSREVCLRPLPLQDILSHLAHILYISATNTSPQTASLLPQRRETTYAQNLKTPGHGEYQPHHAELRPLLP
jgi:hypothetical protein